LRVSNHTILEKLKSESSQFVPRIEPRTSPSENRQHQRFSSLNQPAYSICFFIVRNCRKATKGSIRARRKCAQ